MINRQANSYNKYIYIHVYHNNDKKDQLNFFVF